MFVEICVKKITWPKPMLPMQFYKTNNLCWPLPISAKQFAITFRWNCSSLTTMEVEQIQSCLLSKLCYSCCAGLLEFQFPSETSVWTLALPWLIKLLADSSTWIKEIIIIGKENRQELVTQSPTHTCKYN